jgi:hypothetical protein
MVEVRRHPRFRAMELITILNRCHRFRGFVYQHAHLTVAAAALWLSKKFPGATANAH